MESMKSMKGGVSRIGGGGINAGLLVELCAIHQIIVCIVN